MTVPIIDAENVFPGDGVNKVFSTTISVEAVDAATLTVSLRDETTGVETPLVLNTDYTLTDLGAEDGVTISISGTAPSAFESVVAVRRSSDIQGTSLTLQRGYVPESIESQLDRLTRRVQEVDAILSRTFKTSVTEDDIGPLFLQTAAARASRALTFSDDGTALEIGDFTVDDIANASQFAAEAETSAQLALAAGPFNTRALAEAATIPAPANYISVLSPTGAVLQYKRDASGTALTTVGGVNWSPANEARPEHWADNTTPGTTDMRTAIQAAADWASTNRVLLKFFPTTYLLSGGISATDSLRVDATGAKFLITSNQNAFNFSAALNGPYDLNSDYSEGDLSIDLTGSPLPAAPAQGTVMKIVSDAIDPAQWDISSGLHFRMGEFFVVGEGSTTTNLVLERPLAETDGFLAGAVVPAFTTARAAKVYFVDQAARFEWIGGEIEYEFGHEADPWNANPMIVFGYLRPSIKGLTISRSYNRGLYLQGTYLADVENLFVKEFSNDVAAGQLGYGVNDDGSFGSTIRPLNGEDCRHVYTTTSFGNDGSTPLDMQYYRCGRTVGSTIIGGVSRRGGNAPYDTHNDAAFVTFSNCFVDGTVRQPFTARGRDVTIERPRARNCGDGIWIFTGDRLFAPGKTRAHFTSCRVLEPNIHCDNLPLWADHSTVEVGGRGIFNSSDHRVLKNDGGVLRVVGRHEFTVRSGGGTNNTPIIECLAADAGAVGVFPETIIVIDGDVVINAQDATATGVSIFGGDTGTKIRVRGRLRINAPAGVTWKSGNVELECEGYGVIEYSVFGSADNSIITSSADLSNCNVRSLDGSVMWTDALFASLPAGVITHDFASAAVLSHPGTGATVIGLRVPNGQRVFDLLDQRGEGFITLTMSGIKLGANGPAQIVINNTDADPDQFLGSFVIDADATRWDLHFTIAISATGQQETWGDLTCANDFAAGSVYQARSAETLTPGPGERPLTVGVNAAVGDTIVVKHERVTASSGGKY